ncbi:hypothetical protein [Hyalangium sp.]|uniref:hypothetical protein n=1 Tax=Hyalangium sp. TaxID=2028555 RepID=UPI002D631ECD|nr:hypothetical protein [Hyalangium sp.]HYI02062.1 hypothetical protein [Hyalangium sp.]
MLEDAACNRIEAAPVFRRFPVILDTLASGNLSLSAVRLLSRVLMPENHRDVLDRVRGRSQRDVELLAVTIAPRPDVPSALRKLPTFPQAGEEREEARVPSCAAGRAEPKKERPRRLDGAGLHRLSIPSGPGRLRLAYPRRRS